MSIYALYQFSSTRGELAGCFCFFFVFFSKKLLLCARIHKIA